MDGIIIVTKIYGEFRLKDCKVVSRLYEIATELQAPR